MARMLLKSAKLILKTRIKKLKLSSSEISLKWLEYLRCKKGTLSFLMWATAPNHPFLEYTSQMGPNPSLIKMISVFSKHKLFRCTLIKPENPHL
jgi:hypothetical protein